MDKVFFEELLASVKEADLILEGKWKPGRKHLVEPVLNVEAVHQMPATLKPISSV